MAKPFAQAVARMTIRLLLLAAGTVAGLAAVLWSPVLLLTLLGDGLPWSDLSDIGEAYGGASAVVSAIALTGVAASLTYQVRQTRQEQISSDRQRHLDLLKLGLDDPELFEALDGGGLVTYEHRKKVYANLWMGYWLGLWQLGDLPEAELRHNVSRMFWSPDSRNWWNERRATWIEPRNRRQRRFVALVTDEWHKAESRAAARPPLVTSAKRRRAGATKRGSHVLAGAFAGTVSIAHVGLSVLERRYLRTGRSDPTSHRSGNRRRLPGSWR
ncbi:DUF6082 family protein [Symbioplanes lichenis]|uniref:DUF6082 family protein n=1 Tax=Symbioplanes lichenis TaxID=1629072 RepID=UPI002738D079|nr:DUF6082 family protein [Actinoplanes lichenis]